MTDLHDLCSVEHAGERSTDGIVVFTESEKDADFYNRLIGSGLRRQISFMTPPAAGEGKATGWAAAVSACEKKRNAARTEGLPADRFYCLLDGEEAVRWGHTGFELLSAETLLFRLEDPAADGCLFLNCYEKENLYLLYGSAVEDIRYHLTSYRESPEKNEGSSKPKPLRVERSKPAPPAKPNYDAAYFQRREQHSEVQSTTCNAPAKKFGAHNVWQAMSRSLLSAGLSAACKRSEARDGKKHRSFVSDLTSLHRRRGRVFEDAIFSRLGEYYMELEGLRYFRTGEDGREFLDARRAARASEGDDGRRNRQTIDFWRELYSRYRIIRGVGRKTISQDPFSSEWLRLCDGKSLLTWIFDRNPDLWERSYERQLIANGFGDIFRSALINVLLDEPARTRFPNGVRLPPPVRVRRPPEIHPWSIARR